MSENVLTRNKKRAIAALLLSRSITEAAQACGLADKTINRYMNDDTFRAALSAAEGEAIDRAARRLASMQDAAIDTINDIRCNTQINAGVRLRAAQVMSDYLLKFRELRNVEQRLVILEEIVYGSFRKKN